jgi:glycosyltransferase involved in cell wall biosynthesis
MKILINCSTLSGTGVTQVAVSFITECIHIPNNDYHVFLSRTVENELKNIVFPSNFVFYSFYAHPLYGFKGFKIRTKLRQLEKKIDPDCVFTVFGPSWWTPLKPHLAGYAYPHYVYEDSPFFENISFVEKIKIHFFKSIHLFFLKRNAQFFVCETEDVSKRLVKLFKCKNDHVLTVSNTYNEFFNRDENIDLKLLPGKSDGEFRLLSLCSFAAHKNLVILNKVIPLLNTTIPGNKIRFILTVDDELFEKFIDMEVRDSIINIGRINVEKCPQLYRECDALFLPTTLECFSANYPEAMKMAKPIITSNLSFATSVCGNAALYFDPYNENEIVEVIEDLVNNSDLRERLVISGIKQLNLFLTPKERAEKYISICESII